MSPPPSTDSSTTTTTRLTTVRVVAVALAAFGIGLTAAALVLKAKPATQKTTRQATVPSEALTTDLVSGWPKPMPLLYNRNHLAIDVTAAPGKELPFLEYGPGRTLNLRSFDLVQQSG